MVLNNTEVCQEPVPRQRKFLILHLNSKPLWKREISRSEESQFSDSMGYIEPTWNMIEIKKRQKTTGKKIVVSLAVSIFLITETAQVWNKSISLFLTGGTVIQENLHISFLKTWFYLPSLGGLFGIWMLLCFFYLFFVLFPLFFACKEKNCKLYSSLKHGPNINKLGTIL